MVTMDNERVFKPETIDWSRKVSGEIKGAWIDGNYYWNMPQIWANQYTHEAYHRQIGEDNDRDKK